MLSGWFIMSLFFFNDTATTEIYTLSLHDALPISTNAAKKSNKLWMRRITPRAPAITTPTAPIMGRSAREAASRSEEHTSELQSRQYLVCRLLLEKKKRRTYPRPS